MIYLDHHATTPCDPLVLEAMLPYFTVQFGNPSSAHAAGTRTADAVQQAREQVASLVGAQPGEVIFTSGATEANNLALPAPPIPAAASLFRPLSTRPSATLPSS